MARMETDCNLKKLGQRFISPLLSLTDLYVVLVIFLYCNQLIVVLIHMSFLHFLFGLVFTLFLGE